MNHVNMKVNQYISLHATSSGRWASHIPLDASSSGPELEARSIGTRMMALVGRARARKLGTRRNAGVDRKGRKYRRRKSTATQTVDSARTVKIVEPAAETIIRQDQDKSVVSRYW